MKKYYITFGQSHVHEVKDHYIDKDCVVRYEAVNHGHAREKAFDTFGDKFFTTYAEEDWNEKSLSFFPRGIIDINI